MLALIFALALLAQPLQSPAPAAQPNIEIAAAGDIACDPYGTIDRTLKTLLGWCRMADTARLIEGRHVDAVLALGDEQYQSATTDGFARSYDLSWGKLKSITYPTPGNHEYYTPDAAGYFAYFGARAGDAARGGRLRHGISTGALAAHRPRKSPGSVHPRVLASAAILVGRPSFGCAIHGVLG
jgi:hypothetical protein